MYVLTQHSNLNSFSPYAVNEHLLSFSPYWYVGIPILNLSIETIQSALYEINLCVKIVSNDPSEKVRRLECPSLLRSLWMMEMHLYLDSNNLDATLIINDAYR